MKRKSKARGLCVRCSRRVLVRRSKGFSGVRKPGKDHDLCFRCYKSERDRIQAQAVEASTGD